MEELLEWIVIYVVFLFSTTVHEAAHAWAALAGGDRTAYRGGQVTLDPRPHIQREPIGMVVLPWLGLAMSGFPMGWASTPYDPGWAYAFPKRAAWMALAGPAANLGLALAAGIAMKAGILAGVFDPGNYSLYAGVLPTASASAIFETLALFASALFGMNILLFVLNLIPVPPLDGSAVVSLFVDEGTARRIQAGLHQSGLGMIGILIAFFLVRPIFWSVFPRALDWVWM